MSDVIIQDLNSGGCRRQLLRSADGWPASSRTAQAAARHSDIKLTMRTYTDPKLLDVHAAIESLPSLPLNCELSGQRATGTEGAELAPGLAPTADSRCQFLSHSVNIAVVAADELDESALCVSVGPVKENNPLTSHVNGLHDVDRKGVEPSTSALRTQRSPN